MLTLPEYALDKRVFGPVPTEEAQFISPLVGDALRHWQDLKGGRPYPLRGDFLPENATRFWRYLALLDVLEDDYHIRFFGSKLVETYGELTGWKVSQLDPAIKDRNRLIFDACRDSRAPVYAYWPMSAARDKPFLDVEGLCLPFSKDGSSLDLIAGLNVSSYRRTAG